MKRHPAVERVMERVLGVEWSYQLFDYASSFGVCGMTDQGIRQAVRFRVHGVRTINDALVYYATEIEKAKEMVVSSLISGKGVAPGHTMEGNEIPLEVTR